MDNTPRARYLDRATPPHLTTLILLASMSALAMNIFLPSLPKMAVHFETDYAVVQLSVAIYLMFSAVLQIGIGPLSDNLGRRPVLLWGLALFVVATLGCIYAPNITVFLIFRMLQAVIAVAMVLSRAIIRDVFAQDKSASVMGYVMMGMAVVPMLAPALGGVLDEWFGWQANFWALFVVGLMTFVLCFFDQGETSTKSGKSLLAQFRDYPELLRARRFWGYALASAFCGGAFFAFLGGAPFVGSVVFGMTPSELGVYFGVPAIGYFIGNFMTARLATRLGINRLILWGAYLTTLSGVLLLLVFMAGYGSPFSFFGLISLLGIGNGLVMPNTAAGMLSVRPHLAGTASGLGGAIMIGGGAALSALAGALLSPETGAYPLLWIMTLTAAVGIVSIKLVIRRERTLNL